MCVAAAAVDDNDDDNGDDRGDSGDSDGGCGDDVVVVVSAGCGNPSHTNSTMRAHKSYYLSLCMDERERERD